MSIADKDKELPLDKTNQRPQQTKVLIEKGAAYRIKQLRNEYRHKRAWREQIIRSESVLNDKNDNSLAKQIKSDQISNGGFDNCV